MALDLGNPWTLHRSLTLQYCAGLQLTMQCSLTEMTMGWLHASKACVYQQYLQDQSSSGSVGKSVQMSSQAQRRLRGMYTMLCQLCYIAKPRHAAGHSPCGILLPLSNLHLRGF